MLSLPSSSNIWADILLSPASLLQRLKGRTSQATSVLKGSDRAATQDFSASLHGRQPDDSGNNALGLQGTHLGPQAEALAARLPDMLLKANRIAATLHAGQHGQRRGGWGEAFWQYRQAQPGEPAAHIDWRQSARSTQTYVRETEAEAPQTLLLWCDLSPSMQWCSHSSLPEKRDRALLLQLTVAALLLRSGERVRLLTPAGLATLPSGGSPLERLALGLLRLAETAEHPCPALPVAAYIPRHAHLLITSDFLCEDAALHTVLRQLAGVPSAAHLIHIYDPAERTLPYQGRVSFEGLEQETPLDLPHVQSLRADYEKQFLARHNALAAQAARYGHSLVTHCTQDTPLSCLLAVQNTIRHKAAQKGDRL